MADIIGIDSLRKNLTKYSFYKIKVQKGSETLHYEYIKDDQTQQSDLIDRVEDFFSDLLEVQPNNSRDYTIALYGNDENDYTKKANKPFVQFKFQLTQKDYNIGSTIKQPVNNLPSDYIDLVRENEKLKSHLARQQDLIDDLNADDDDDDDVVQQSDQEQLIGAIKEAVMPRLPQIIDYLLGNNINKPVINGIDDPSMNFNEVITELKRYDDQLLSDLNILLNLAKTNTPMFNMLIGQLRKM